MPLLNFFTKGFFLYLLSLAVLLNSCTNSFIIFSPCSNFLSSTTFTVSLSPSLNFFFFQLSTNSPYIYDSIYWICSSTASSLILILIYNLYAVINPNTFPELPSNTYSLATFMFASILGTTSFSYVIRSVWTWAYSAARCSCCCWAKNL